MSLKMRYYYIVGIWSFCFVLPIMMGCMREEKKSSKDSFEMLYQQMEQASVESPELVSQMVDSASIVKRQYDVLSLAFFESKRVLFVF